MIMETQENNNNRWQSFSALIKESCGFFRKIIASPSEAFTAIDEGDNALLKQSAVMYAVYLLMDLAFYALKPVNFPPPSADMPVAKFTFSGWLIADVLSSAVFLAGWVFLLSILEPLARKTRMILFLSVCALVALAPAGFMAAFSASSWRGALFVGSLAIFYAGMWRIARVPDFPYKKILSLLLATSALETISLAAQIPGLIFRLETAYMAAQLIGALWVLGVTIRGVEHFCKTGIARAAAAVLSTLVASFVIILALANNGIISKNTLALFFAN